MFVGFWEYEEEGDTGPGEAPKQDFKKEPTWPHKLLHTV